MEESISKSIDGERILIRDKRTPLALEDKQPNQEKDD